MIEKIKEVVKNKYNIDITVTDEVRDLADNVHVFHIIVPEEFKIFECSIVSFCNKVLHDDTIRKEKGIYNCIGW